MKTSAQPDLYVNLDHWNKKFLRWDKIKMASAATGTLPLYCGQTTTGVLECFYV